MKNIISSITDNISTRLKNPFIGAFVFSWVVVHIKGVSVFLLVDTQAKIDILRNKDWLLWGDAIFPLLISIAYLIALPLIHLLYDHFESGWLTPKRLAISRKKTVAQVRAEAKYIRDYEYNDLSRLIRGKEELLETAHEFITLLEEYRESHTRADRDKFLKLERATNKLSNVAVTLRTSGVVPEYKTDEPNRS